MNRIILAFSLSLSIGGCAAVDGNFMGGRTPIVNAPKQNPGVVYEAMPSGPPAPLKEDVPSLRAGEVWVPGYYQPVAGDWLWHQGQVRETPDGRTLTPARYREENGKVYFTPPAWRPNELSAGKTK